MSKATYFFSVSSVLLSLASAPLQAQPGANPVTEPQPARGGVMQLDQTVISGNQELPKVLYILPWREPKGLPQIEVDGDFSEEEVFKRLYPPAYRRELGYFETLNGLQHNEHPDQE